MRTFPIRLFSKCLLIFTGLVIALVSLSLLSSFKEQWLATVILLFLSVLVVAFVFDSVSQEIQIDENGISLNKNLSKRKITILWKDIERVWYPGTGTDITSITIYSKQGESLTVTSQYKDVAEILDKVNSRFPLTNLQRIKQGFRPVSLLNVFVLGALLCGVFTFLMLYLQHLKTIEIQSSMRK